MDQQLIIPIITGFIIALFFTPFWIRKAKEIGLVWNDMNKTSSEKVAGSGGIVAVLGFVIAVLIFIAYRTFALQSNLYLIEILAMLAVVLFLSGVGLIDDLFGWQRGGLSIRTRIILVLLAAIPLVVINAGRSIISLPFIGNVELGLIYPLIFIPIGILGATTTYNFLAGFNGLEAGQGIIILSGISVVSFFLGEGWLSVIALCMIAASLGFLVYNFYPAKVFPGDSFTYATGGLIAILAILGNFEKIALFFFIPIGIETILKLRGGLKKHSFGKPVNEGLEMKYNKFYSLNHIAIYLLNKTRFGATEKRVVYLIWTFQILIILIGLFVFREGIFGAI